MLRGERISRGVHEVEQSDGHELKKTLRVAESGKVLTMLRGSLIACHRLRRRRDVPFPSGEVRFEIAVARSPGERIAPPHMRCS